jgi:mevalonate kinase
MQRACGKAILLGEHAVVHGVPALVVGLDRGVEAVALPTPSASESTLSINHDLVATSAQDHDLALAFRALLAEAAPPSPVQVQVTSALPVGAGVGSSAALGVAIARALAEAFALPPSLDRDLALALSWERIFHGNPSGIDTAAAARGGCLLYTRGSPPEPLRLRSPLSLAIAYSGYGSSTRTMVESVARQKERRPEVFAKQLDAIRSLVSNARLALEAGDLIGLGKLMDLNQMILAGWMLSTGEIEQLCALAREAGALGAKLTGAGGGGCVVALCNGDPGPILDAWRGGGFTCFASSVS